MILRGRGWGGVWAFSDVMGVLVVIMDGVSMMGLLAVVMDREVARRACALALCGA